MTFEMTSQNVQSLGTMGRFDEADFAKMFGLKKSRSKTLCIRRLLGKQCKIWRGNPYYQGDCDCEHDFGIDHLFMFYRPGDAQRGALTAFVWFPYGNDSFFNILINRLYKWAELRGLSVAVLPPDTGWYGHGTNMVVVWRELTLMETNILMCKNGIK